MFQLKTKYIQDDLVDLDMKLGEQIAAVQIDNSKSQEKNHAALDSIHSTLKMETGRMYAIQREIREEVKKMQESHDRKGPNVHDASKFATNPSANNFSSPMEESQNQEKKGDSFSTFKDRKGNSTNPDCDSQTALKEINPSETTKTHRVVPNDADNQAIVDNSQELGQLWKAIPRTADWETFSGKGEYNHNLFIKQVDIANP
ncbi:hypothetical protein PCASD_17960 [Puccinia coronata f. sp. avenae]|uniref:Uncharacterized protein n=1 Tax=Puccinia coronata f. sp. avenae TaxID=200324 RepID=A0A2N5U3Y4_9BASI|nr:hypothetical protein PCASD_20287 [Puccinia coronata f. sp. avenae]PLW32463.1 hypothetical protein PCASD_17960 [Puccinia coronata f. sp. avenae]